MKNVGIHHPIEIHLINCLFTISPHPFIVHLSNIPRVRIQKTTFGPEGPNRPALQISQVTSEHINRFFCALLRMMRDQVEINLRQVDLK
jgi:hypothetical protein